MDPKAAVVLGEASESDEDSQDIKTGLAFKYLKNTGGTIISGEATESDEDGISSASIAIDPTSCPPYYINSKSISYKKNIIKYNSLLHKKLSESNNSLKNNIVDLAQGTINDGIQHLNNINIHLIKSELTVQDAACQLRNESTRGTEASSALHHILNSNFLNTIK